MEQTSIKLSGTAIKKASGPIKWTNKYDCPPGYVFNSKGYIITQEVYPKIWVSTLLHLDGIYTPTTLFYYNLLALYYLNPNKPFTAIKAAVYNRIQRSRRYSKPIPPEIIEDAIKLYNLFEGDISEELPEEFCKMETIWYSDECEVQNTLAVMRLRTFSYMDDIRDLMKISGRYKTAEVSKHTNQPAHTVRRYWKKRGLTPAYRIANAIIDADTYFMGKGIDNPTQKRLSEVSGVSIPTIRRLKK